MLGSVKFSSKIEGYVFLCCNLVVTVVENHIHSTEENVVLPLSIEKCNEIMKCFLYFKLKVYEYTLIV